MAKQSGLKIEWNAKRITDKVRANINIAEKQLADKVVSDAQHLCPTKEGVLKNSIRSVEGKYGGYLVIAGGIGDWGDAFYAPFIELGTHNTMSKPFLKPAMHKNKSNFKRRLKQALK